MRPDIFLQASAFANAMHKFPQIITAHNVGQIIRAHREHRIIWMELLHTWAKITPKGARGRLAKMHHPFFFAPSPPLTCNFDRALFQVKVFELNAA